MLPRSEGRYPAGLILHRPADPPAQSTLHGYGWIQVLFFGTDPGVCRGCYVAELATL